MFFRDPGGNAGPTLYTVDVTGRNEQLLKTPSYASDPGLVAAVAVRHRAARGTRKAQKAPHSRRINHHRGFRFFPAFE